MRTIRLLGAALTLMCLTFPALSAGIYKWTDEQGNVHYTQSPPPGDQKAETIAPPPDVNTEKAQRDLEQKQKKLEEMEQQRQQAEEQQREQEERAALYRRNCEIASERLAKLENTGRVRVIDEEGNMTRIGTGEKQERIEAVKKDVEKYCSARPG